MATSGSKPRSKPTPMPVTATNAGSPNPYPFTELIGKPYHYYATWMDPGPNGPPAAVEQHATVALHLVQVNQRMHYGSISRNLGGSIVARSEFEGALAIVEQLGELAKGQRFSRPQFRNYLGASAMLKELLGRYGKEWGQVEMTEEFESRLVQAVADIMSISTGIAGPLADQNAELLEACATDLLKQLEPIVGAVKAGQTLTRGELQNLLGVAMALPSLKNCFDFAPAAATKFVGEQTFHLVNGYLELSAAMKGDFSAFELVCSNGPYIFFEHYRWSSFGTDFITMLWVNFAGRPSKAVQNKAAFAAGSVLQQLFASAGSSAAAPALLAAPKQAAGADIGSDDGGKISAAVEAQADASSCDETSSSSISTASSASAVSLVADAANEEEVVSSTDDSLAAAEAAAPALAPAPKPARWIPSSLIDGYDSSGCDMHQPEYLFQAEEQIAAPVAEVFDMAAVVEPTAMPAAPAPTPARWIPSSFVDGYASDGCDMHQPEFFFGADGQQQIVAPVAEEAAVTVVAAPAAAVAVVPSAESEGLFIRAFRTVGNAVATVAAAVTTAWGVVRGLFRRRRS